VSHPQGNELPRNCDEPWKAPAELTALAPTERKSDSAIAGMAERRAGQEIGAMQMGPALLPTPLSPACG